MWPRLWGEKARGERPETGGLRVPENSRFFKESRRGLRAVGRTPRSRLGRTSWRDGETDTRDCSSRGSEAPAAFALPSDTVWGGQRGSPDASVSPRTPLVHLALPRLLRGMLAVCLQVPSTALAACEDRAPAAQASGLGLRGRAAPCSPPPSWGEGTSGRGGDQA